MPGIVKGFSAGPPMTVDVQPALRWVVPEDGEFVEEELALVREVPLVLPQMRGLKIQSVTLQEGDEVLLIVQDFDISDWRRTGGLSTPLDARNHDYGSIVAIPGLASDAHSLPAPADSAALTSKVDARLDVVVTKLNELITAYLEHIHTETGASTGVPTVVTITTTADPATVASAVLKLGS